MARFEFSPEIRIISMHAPSTRLLALLIALKSALSYEFGSNPRLLSQQQTTKQSLSRAFSATISLGALLVAPRSIAAQSLREDISNTAAKIPGFGASNVVYPDVFEGEWSVDKDIYDIFGKKGVDIASLPLTIDLLDRVRDYQRRKEHLFFKERYSRYEGKVVLDRAISSSNYYRELLQEPNILSSWDVSNPNLLTVTTPQGKITEFRVTKRAVEESPPASEFSGLAVGYSEYSRVAEVDAGGLALAVPKVFGLRSLVRLKQDPEAEVPTFKGVERTYIYEANTLDIGFEPLITVKSRFIMKKIK